MISEAHCCVFLPFSLDFSDKFCSNEHFWTENILQFPQILPITNNIETILQNSIILGPKLKMRLKYFKFPNEVMVDKLLAYLFGDLNYLLS